MGGWRRGTTPVNVFEVNRDLRGTTVFVSYAQRGRVIVEKTGDDLIIREDTVETHLSQEDTLQFRTGEVRIQFRYVTEDGRADASNIIITTAEEILKDGVITYV